MKIEHIDIVPYRATLVRPLVTARGIVDERCGFLLRLRDEKGHEGWGEAAPIHWMEGDLRNCERALARLRGLAGREDSALRDRVASLTIAYPEAACALDTALLDLQSREAGTSVSRLLAKGNGNGHAESPLRVSALLTQTTPKRIAGEAAARAEAGYDCLKLKLGSGSTWEDVERVAAVRENFTGEIRIDANAAWTLVDAITACRNFERYDIAWLEDPLPAPEDSIGQSLNSWRELAESTSVPLALDEGSQDDNTRGLLTGIGALDWIILKLARTGGPTRAYAIARELADGKAKVAFTDSIETGVGQRAVVQTATAVATANGDIAAIGLGGALTLAELKLDDDAECMAAQTLRGPHPVLTLSGLG